MPATGLPFDDIRALLKTMPQAGDGFIDDVRARDRELTKPAGSLGRMEELVEHMAAWQARSKPAVTRPVVAVFVANHGVVAQGVSAFPQAVTRAMLDNFAAGGAAINVLARQAGAEKKATYEYTLAVAYFDKAREENGANEFGHADLLAQASMDWAARALENTSDAEREFGEEFVPEERIEEVKEKKDNSLDKIDLDDL